MKFIYITCNVSMLETLTLLLDEMEYADYQVIEQVTAMSRWGEPRQNTAVWRVTTLPLLCRRSIR